ncbi:MAG: IS110 family transposase [Desulfomonilaceae bacterium]
MPSKKENSSVVSVVHDICCGLDVHKKIIAACLVSSDAEDGERSELMEFETFTDDLIKLRDWLLERECPVVAMESTGPYWTPVHNILEGYVQVILVNPRHMKNVPGRKTDISDSRWLAGLLRHGLVKAAFIPPKYQRQWRDLTRMRKNYMQTVGHFKRRVHKLFQEANIKIDSALADLFGSTGRNLMRLLVSKESSLTFSEVEDCLRGSLREKGRELYRSVKGFFEEHHRVLLSFLLDTIEKLEGQIEELELRIRQVLKTSDELIDRLKEIPGVGDTSAHSLLAELGTTLEAFPSAAALAAWCGICPGNNQSGGKRFSGRSRVRNHHLKTIMVEISWPAVKKRGSYYKAKYYALKSRLGGKKAIIAVAHRILKAIYYVIKHGVRFKDLGEAYLLERSKASKIRYLCKQASLLGFELKPLT